MGSKNSAPEIRSRARILLMHGEPVVQPFAQKLEMPWLLTSASSLIPALHIGHSRAE